MKKPPINTTKQAFPQIYAYTTPGVTYHDGWTKIGYTEHKDARTRIDQQTVTADIHYQLEWSLPAIYDDGSFDIFKDTDFHTYLEKKGIERLPGKEWFHIAPPPAKNELRDFKENRGLIVDDDIRAYRLRAEQQEAVSKAKDYFLLHERGEFLWNAKPRFGKTLASYDLCKQLDARNVLIVTNRPAIANSWYDDYCKFLGVQSDYLFVSNAESLNGDPTTYKHVKSREEFDAIAAKKKDIKRIEFISLQDLKGARRFGGNFQKLNHVAEIDWDLLIIDEAHEGIDTYRTDVAFDHIKRKHTLHLSGTPFKALASNKFAPDAIYNWTYADEQKAKRDWASEENDPNPYEDLPRLNLFTYQMSEIVREQVAEGVEIDGEKQEYAFDLNEFFEVNPATKRFVHDVDVNRFLDALATQEKFPFSTEELRTELKHTLWILNRVDSAKALINKLRHHDVFKDYKIVPAIGDGRIDENDVATKSYDAVRKAIRENPRTITISVGQLTTGVTIPEWTGVLMLSNMKSPSLYMQAAFRCQNPCLFKVGSQYLRKKDSYVFDFDPARTLIIFEEFANDLSADTSGGRGDTETRKKHIKELLNFFPVYGEDPDGEMVELDAEKVLTIPRKLKSREVVNHGFMSNYLFQNISTVFSAPLEVIEKIKQLTPAKDPGAMGDINKNTKEELSLNDDGEVDIPNEQVIGTATELFGDKIYGDADDFFYDMSGDEDVVDDDFDWFSPTSNEIPFDSIKDRFKTNYIEQMLDAAKKTFGDTLKESTKSDLNRKMSSDADSIIKHNQLDHKIEKTKLLEERDKALDKAKTDAESKDIERQFEQKAKELARDFEKKTISICHTAVSSKDGVIYVGSVAYGYEGAVPESGVITIADGTAVINADAFENVPDAAAFSFPDSLINIKGRALDGTAWYAAKEYGPVFAGNVLYAFKKLPLPTDTAVTVPEGTTGIADGAFEQCNDRYYITSVLLPESLKYIGDNAFEGCSGLGYIIIPDGVTHIGAHAFQDCSDMRQAVLGKGLTYLPDFAFFGCDLLTSVNLGGIRTIGENALSSCGFVALDIPEGVEEVESYAFSGCYELSMVRLPASRTSAASSFTI